MPIIGAVLVAGGSSQRMGGVNKLFLKLGARTVIERSIAALENNALVNEIVVVTTRADIERVAQLSAGYPKVTHIVEGGHTRFESVQNGVARCAPGTQYYAIHDAARPFASDELISAVIRAAIRHGAAAPGHPVTDTIKALGPGGIVEQTPDRDKLYAIETPQVFEAAAYRAAAQNAVAAFDDCQIMERAGYPVYIIEGEIDNIKITTPADVARAEQIAEVYGMRVGQGYDVHRLAEGRKLILGGVEIPHSTGLDGHSDADVLAHAIMDALLGGAAMGDIGHMFPANDSRFKDADSIGLLSEVGRRLEDADFSVMNIDATVVCQTPRLAGHIPAMRANIAAALELPAERVNIKATTEEKLGFTGEERGIAAQAVALIRQK